MKISELKDLAAKIVKEMSSTGGGTVQGANTAGNSTGEQYFAPVRTKKVKQGVRDVEPKLAAGKVKNNYSVSHFGYTPAPSIPNRKSKAMDYKKLFEGDDLEAIKSNVISWSKSKRNKNEDSLETNWWKEFDDTVRSANSKDEIKAAILDMYYMGDFDWSKLGLEEAYDKATIRSNAEELARVEDMIKTATSSQMASQEDRIKKLRILVSLEKKHNIQLPTLHYGTYWVDYLKQQGVKNSQELDAKLAAKGEDLNENYSQFRNKTSRRDGAEQLHKAVKEIKKKLVEVDRLIEYTTRLRTEVTEGEGEVKYNTHTTRALEQIQEKIKHTYIKAKKLK
jgi:hypothetical protein